MNTLVIYDTTFGNTAQIARAIADTLSAHGKADIRRVDEARPLDLQGTDLLIIGCPTQRQAMTPAVRAALDNIPRRSLRGHTAAAFDTRYRMGRLLALFTAARGIASRLKRTGAVLLAPPESFIVVGREGPLEDGELAHAARWAEQLAAHHAAIKN
jgi:flavodoxin